MWKRVRLFSIVTLLAASLAACASVNAASTSEAQVASASAAQSESSASPRTITVVGKGKVSIRPDIAKIMVGAAARADTVSEAKTEVDALMAAITAALQAAGVAEKDIQTFHYSIHNEQEPPMPVMLEGSAPENHGGYRVANIIQVTVRDVEKAGDLLDAAVQAGANQVHGVTFTVSDESKWQGQAREKAMADARARAGELAGLAGVELGELMSVSEVIGGVLMPLAMDGLGGGITPGELELGTQVQVTFAIQ